jgi:catechol 2,3-dioxygenase-like lactoylglutathione lyase family enzyme
MGVLGISHIAFRTPDPARLNAFYARLLTAERLEGEHGPLRVGSTTLVFFPSDKNEIGPDPDEIAFDVDIEGFWAALERARELGVLEREPVQHTAASRGFLVRDPDGRRVEIAHEDRGVYWRE